MLRKSDYWYELPEDRIAQVPADRRDGSRLLRVAEPPVDLRFPQILELLPADAVLVVNDTRVIPARLRARKGTGGEVEILLVQPATSGTWMCLARASKLLRPGARLSVLDRDGAPAAEVTVASARGDGGALEIDLGADVDALLARCGDLPLPPYIERPAGATAADRERYQTVYARAPGAIAAPTAGLHFTPELLAAAEARGAAVARLTLHVGPGTFVPVRDDDLAAHKMHAERFHIPEATAALCASGRPVVAVGTTAVRALEASALATGRVAAGDGATDLFIRPGFRFQVVDHLITNFHLPGSTLLMLVAAFAGHARTMAAYAHALAAGYRFYSYGDAMWCDREGR
jgi:S-adenosylmethionine:tRNA ribosyltransferase-isomerase